MNEKYKGCIVIGVILALVAGLIFLFWFGLSDFTGTGMPHNDIAETKPWRPIARAVFSITMGALLIFFSGLTIKLTLRDRD